jgi:hypothetical protein
MLVSVSAFAALVLGAAQPAGPITDWREAVRCLAAFEAAASRSFAAQAPDAAAGYDDQALALFASMGERFDFARMEQAETIRAREAEALRPLSLEQVQARADDCRARLPDPPAIP